ncbi:MAG: hypothetical protein RLY67_22, partial [Pseudomonadota bacterium]
AVQTCKKAIECLGDALVNGHVEIR